MHFFYNMTHTVPNILYSMWSILRVNIRSAQIYNLEIYVYKVFKVSHPLTSFGL